MYGQLWNLNLCERFRNTLVLAIVYTYWYGIIGAAPWAGARGAKAPLKISRKGKFKNMGHVFPCIKVIKISFSVIFNEEIRALEGRFYQNFSTKKASLSKF